MIRALVISLTLATSAGAQANCATRGAVIAKLGGQHSEEFHGGGLQTSQAVFEVWVSEDKRTWTILRTRADGVSCILAHGTNWRDGREFIPGVPG